MRAQPPPPPEAAAADAAAAEATAAVVEEEWADVVAEFDDGAELHSHQVDPLLGVLATAGGTLTPPLGAPEALATLDRAGIEDVARDFLAGWWPLVAGDLPASLQDSLELHQAAPAGFGARVDFRQVLAGVPVFHPVRISLGRNLEVYQFLGPILTEDAIVEDFAVTADAAEEAARGRTGATTAASVQPYWLYDPRAGLAPLYAVRFAMDLDPEEYAGVVVWSRWTYTVDGTSGEVVAENGGYAAEDSPDACLRAMSGRDDLPASDARIPDADMLWTDTDWGGLHGPWFSVFDERDNTIGPTWTCTQERADGDETPRKIVPLRASTATSFCAEPPYVPGTDMNYWEDAADPDREYAANAYRRLYEYVTDFVTPLSGVDLDDPNLVPESRRLTIMVEASAYELVESQVPAGQTWMTSSNRPVNECLEGFPENGGDQMNAPFWSRPAIVLNGGSSDLTKMGRSRSRGVLFHEFGHYFFHYVLGNIDGDVFDDWPWGVGPLQATPFMVGAMDEGLNYYLPSAYMSEWGVPFNLSFAAVHCPEAAYDQKLNRFFLKKTDIAACFDTSGNEGDTCPRSYRYNGPQFELADGISDTMAAFETFDWNGTPWVRALVIDLNTNPTGDPRYVDGYTLADEAEAALDAQGWCDYAVTWTPGEGAHGDAFPGAGGFRIEVASNPADDCDEVASVDFFSQADPSSVLPTMGFLLASHYLASGAAAPECAAFSVCADDTFDDGSWDFASPKMTDHGGPPVVSRAYNSTWLRSMASCGGTDDENLHGSTSRREDGVHFVGDWVAQSLWHARNVGRGCPPTDVDAAVLLSMVDLSYLSSCPYYSELGPEVCGDLFDMQFTHRILWHLQNDSGCTGSPYNKTKEALEQHGAWSPVPPP